MALGNSNPASGEGADPGDRDEPADEKATCLFEEADITEREQDVLRLIAEGNSCRATAEQLHITEGTVRSCIRRIYGKLNVHSRQELIDLLRPERQLNSSESPSRLSS